MGNLYNLSTPNIWPTNNLDLNPPDYYVRSIVEKEKDSLKGCHSLSNVLYE